MTQGIKVILEDIALAKYPKVKNCQIRNTANAHKRQQLIKRFMDISVKINYEREQTDCRLCSACEQMIITDMFKAVVEVMGERIVSEKFVYCESCFELLNKEA